MKPILQVGHRVKYGSLRGTILKVTMIAKVQAFEVQMDNGARVMGTSKQFSPAVRRS